MQTLPIAIEVGAALSIMAPISLFSADIFAGLID